MTWPPHPISEPRGPVLRPFPPGSATARAWLFERAWFPETNSRVAESHAQVGTGSPTAALRSSISLGIPEGGGRDVRRGPVHPQLLQGFPGGGGRGVVEAPAELPLQNQMLRTLSEVAPQEPTHKGCGESKELNEIITNWEACTSSMFGSSS